MCRPAWRVTAMPLHNQKSALGILYLNYNQDATCITIADSKGIKIYSVDTHKVCYAAELGAVRCVRVFTCLLLHRHMGVEPDTVLRVCCSICEQLFCTSLLGWVGAGAHLQKRVP